MHLPHQGREGVINRETLVSNWVFFFFLVIKEGILNLCCCGWRLLRLCVFLKPKPYLLLWVFKKKKKKSQFWVVNFFSCKNIDVKGFAFFCNRQSTQEEARKGKWKQNKNKILGIKSSGCEGEDTGLHKQFVFFGPKWKHVARIPSQIAQWSPNRPSKPFYLTEQTFVSNPFETHIAEFLLT